MWLESAATPRALRATAIQTKQCHRRYRSAFLLQSPSTESICELFHIIPAFIRCLVIVSIVLSKVLLNYCSIEILEGLNMFPLPTFKPQNPHLVNVIILIRGDSEHSELASHRSFVIVDTETREVIKSFRG